MKKLGARLRTAREKAGISLCEMARRIDVHPNYIHRVELGILHSPNEDRLVLICDELGMDFYELMRKAGRVPSDVTKYITRTPGVLERIRREMAAA